MCSSLTGLSGPGSQRTNSKLFKLPKMATVFFMVRISIAAHRSYQFRFYGNCDGRNRQSMRKVRIIIIIISIIKYESHTPIICATYVDIGPTLTSHSPCPVFMLYHFYYVVDRPSHPVNIYFIIFCTTNGKKGRANKFYNLIYDRIRSHNSYNIFFLYFNKLSPVDLGFDQYATAHRLDKLLSFCLPVCPKSSGEQKKPNAKSPYTAYSDDVTPGERQGESAGPLAQHTRTTCARHLIHSAKSLSVWPPRIVPPSKPIAAFIQFYHCYYLLSFHFCLRIEHYLNFSSGVFFLFFVSGAFQISFDKKQPKDLYEHEFINYIVATCVRWLCGNFRCGRIWRSESVEQPQ